MAGDIVLRDKQGFQISEGNYADRAKDIMAKRRAKDKQGKDTCFLGLKNTKLRGIYGQIVNVNSRVANEEDFEKAKGDVQYLKVKMAYEAGRTNAVKDFLEHSHLLALLDNLESYDQFKLYCRYAESLVAYFTYYGGKEQ